MFHKNKDMELATKTFYYYECSCGHRHFLIRSAIGEWIRDAIRDNEENK